MTQDDSRYGHLLHGVALNDVRPDGIGRRLALIADEDPSILWLLRRALVDDFDLAVAQDGQRAVELAGTARPDVVLLDLGMPVLDGFAACRRIRPVLPRIPIVIVSGRTDEGSGRAAFEAGAIDYLAKPFTSSQLRARLQACLLRSSSPALTGCARAAAQLQQEQSKAALVQAWAEAEAEANRARAASITPTLVESDKRRRWNGQMPTTVLGNDSTMRGGAGVGPGRDALTVAPGPVNSERGPGRTSGALTLQVDNTTSASDRTPECAHLRRYVSETEGASRAMSL